MIKFRQQLITSRVLADLKRRSTIGIGFYLVAAAVVVSSNGYYHRHPGFSGRFLWGIAAICLFRLVHMGLDRRLPRSIVNSAIFITSVIATGVVWGLGMAIFMFMPQPGEIETQQLMVVCTIGLCAGGVMAFIPNIWVTLGFNTAMLLPGIVSMLVTKNVSLGMLFILFYSYTTFMAVRQNKEYWTALDNEYLLAQKTKALKQLSNLDGLTGLYNRRYFDNAFALEWKRAVRARSPICVLICDVDHFKKVNDQYGHLAGDEYLKLVAKWLQRMFRRETDIVARYGGEEFVAVIPEESVGTVRTLAEKIRRTAEETPLNFEGRNIFATISMGLAWIRPEQGMAKETILSEADRVLYQAKNEGRNRVCAVSLPTLAECPPKG